MANREKDSYYYSASASEYMNPKDGSYQYEDPQDFDEYIELINSGQATKRHHDEYDLRLICHFIENAGETGEPSQWVMNKIADKFLKVIYGGRWEDEFRLPWTKTSLPWSPSEKKDLDLFCEITTRIKSTPKSKVTEVIKSVSNEYNVSYEKARAAYYKHKHLIK